MATLVAEVASPSAVSASVAEEVGRLLAVDAAAVRRYHLDGTGEILASWSRRGEIIPVGLRAQPVVGTVTAIVRGIGARLGLTGTPMKPAGLPVNSASDLLWACRSLSLVSCGVSSPWYRQSKSHHHSEPRNVLQGLPNSSLPRSRCTGSRRAEPLVDEQAALGRVATLVAEGEPPGVVFAAVAEQVGRLLSTDDALVARFEPDESVNIVASWSAAGEPLPVGLPDVKPGEGLTPVVREPPDRRVSIPRQRTTRSWESNPPSARRSRSKVGSGVWSAWGCAAQAGSAGH